MVVALHASAAVNRLSHRFLNPSALLIWLIRAAIVWVVALPVALRAIQTLVQLESAPPPAFVAFFFVFFIGKLSLLVLLGRALDRVQGKKAAQKGSTVQLQSHTSLVPAS